MSTSPLILVLNCGSSSVKFSVFEPVADGGLVELQSGLAERVSHPDATLTIRSGDEKTTVALDGADHDRVITELLNRLRSSGLADRVIGVGHRVVHGGEFFASATVVDKSVVTQIESCSRLAPLHNPANVAGIKLTTRVLPDVPNIAVFDTAFHQSMPPTAYRYAIPDDWYTELGVRKYGFHGTSHQYVSSVAADKLKGRASGILTAHLGNGCSAAAVVNGTCVDTSMGMTPLDGLVMGTRSGSVDPGLHQYIAAQLDIDIEAVTEALNKKSGLLGLSGCSNDMRTLLEAEADGHADASLAIDVFCFRLAKELGALAMSLDRLDGLVFTGGIGENAPMVRKRTVDHLALLGFSIDETANDLNGSKTDGNIGDTSGIPIFVIKTAEEEVIAKQALALAVTDSSSERD